MAYNGDNIHICSLFLYGAFIKKTEIAWKYVYKLVELTQDAIILM